MRGPEHPGVCPSRRPGRPGEGRRRGSVCSRFGGGAQHPRPAQLGKAHGGAAVSGPGLGRLGGGDPLLSPVSPGPAPGASPWPCSRSSSLRAESQPPSRGCPRRCRRAQSGRHVRPVPWGWPSGWLGASLEPSAHVGTPPWPAWAALWCPVQRDGDRP